MKIASPDILHKSDVGGVKINIASAEAARDAYAEVKELDETLFAKDYESL
jgi:acyl-CoA synthetase (NDP forming)